MTGILIISDTWASSDMQSFFSGKSDKNKLYLMRQKSIFSLTYSSQQTFDSIFASDEQTNDIIHNQFKYGIELHLIGGITHHIVLNEAVLLSFCIEHHQQRADTFLFWIAHFGAYFELFYSSLSPCSFNKFQKSHFHLNSSSFMQFSNHYRRMIRFHFRPSFLMLNWWFFKRFVEQKWEQKTVRFKRFLLSLWCLHDIDNGIIPAVRGI